MQKITIDTLDSENLSNDAKDLIHELLLLGFSPKQIKDSMNVIQEFQRVGISPELAREIYFYMAKNW
jgi:hypothetical protein